MALLCFVTDQLLKDATTHGVAKSKVEAFATEIEKRQSVAGFDHFPPPCLTKKKIFGFNFRLIAAEKHVGDHLVIVLLRLVVRGSNDYAAFLDDPPTWAGRHYDAELNDAKLATWVADRTKKELPAPARSISDTEQMFLWSSPYAEQTEDIMVCETHEWVQAIREARITDRLIRLPEVIVNVADGPAGQVQILRSSADKSLAVLACNLPSTRQCVLLSVSYAESDSQLQLQQATWSEKLQAADSEKVLRYSRRSYPSILCYDDDMWMTVQKDPQANLALSPEEADILQASAQSGFPLFINGRAGSGKSTLLQYLFAQSLLRWACQSSWESVADSRPLYIASSRELLKVAQDVVRSLLKANHEHLLASHRIDTHLLDTLGGCFQEFQLFMQTALAPDAKSRFPVSGYVSYAKFRRLWVERFGREKRAIHEVGPQISWHVIRGYIKGMSVDDLLAKGDYNELPEDERTVSRQVYEAVYDRVWEAWYEPLCRSGGAWDSQDLVRFLLDEEQLPASHVAVFCDEAQDFTRLELEAIYRCSLFSDRQIDHLSVKRVPFVFAGDPFQTLNPTGFRWESVRAAFTERILRSLYRCNARADVPQLNYRELTFNYRSSKRIVHLCNAIQAVRASLFGHRSLSPQNTWQLGNDASAPVFFETGDAQMEAALREQSDLVLIVPCEEGEEVDYVATDPYLKSFVQADDDGTPRNVLSAARAKGLEFLRVALYGWSAKEEAKTLSKMMRSPGEDGMTVEKRLGLEYFMNNLYVAASRAQRRLFVIDNRGSRDGLWWFATDEQHLLQLIENLPKGEVWKGHTGCLVRGVPESFREDREDPRAIAEQFEREGLSKEDSYLLKQAGLQYLAAGETTKAHECRARADLFDGRFRDAGDHFKKAGVLEKSIDAYWRGRHYKEIEDCAWEKPEFTRNARCRVAVFVRGGSQTIRECRSLIEQIVENAKINELLPHDLKSNLWKDALHKAVQKSVEGKDKEKGVTNAEDAGALADLLVQIGRLGAQVDAKQIARLFFAARRYQEVLKILSSDDGSEMFRDANALALIEESTATSRSYNPTESRIVADYYFRQKEYEKAAGLLEVIRDSGRLLECLRQSLQVKEPRENDGILLSTVTVLIANAEWESLISLLTNGHPRLAKQEEWGKSACAAVLDCVRHTKMTFKLVIPALARSAELSNADAKAQQQVSEFLSNHLIKVGYSAWRNDLSREIGGAAIERAGRDIDALQFYESWRDSAGSHAAREYPERRWVVCKLRQATREEREGHEKKAKSYRQDAGKVMEKYGWTEDAVPDGYPEISVQDTASAPHTGEAREPRPQVSPDGVKNAKDPKNTGDHKGRLGSLSYRVITAKGWINLDSEDGLRARVLVRERTVTSEDVSVKLLDGGNAECEEWGLQIRWLSDSVVEFRLGEEECQVVLGESASKG
jgi:hypothetical protein